MKKKIIIGVWSVIILSLAIVFIRPVILDNARKVKFKDERMEREIAINARVESVDEFRVDDLEKVKSLDIRYTGFYNTISDIEKCQQLSYLVIGQNSYGNEFESANQDDWPGPESKERIQQIKRELESILQNCSKLTYLTIIGEKKYFELGDLDFLKNGKNLESISLDHHVNMDYSAIGGCSGLHKLKFWNCDVLELDMLDGLKKLELLSLAETNVSEAGDIVKLKALKELMIRNTPLGGNGEQLALILENCSNLRKLTLSGENGELSNLDFLKNGKNLRSFVVKYQPAIDYSAITECTQLEYLSLYGCDISDVGMLSKLENLETLVLTETNISEAKDILNIKNLKELSIVDTPLAENQEQLALIYQQFPDIILEK